MKISFFHVKKLSALDRFQSTILICSSALSNSSWYESSFLLSSHLVLVIELIAVLVWLLVMAWMLPWCFFFLFFFLVLLLQGHMDTHLLTILVIYVAFDCITILSAFYGSFLVESKSFLEHQSSADSCQYCHFWWAIPCIGSLSDLLNSPWHWCQVYPTWHKAAPSQYRSCLAVPGIPGKECILVPWLWQWL